jgi:NAD(P)H dehydrogenase (quinone)
LTPRGRKGTRHEYRHHWSLGELGRLVVSKLKARAATTDLVALVRSPAKVTDLGVATRQTDYTKPAVLDHAFVGIDLLLLISASELGQRVARHHNVIEAAKKAKVKRIVYTSLLHADTSPLDLADEHRATEGELKGSGIPFTILRNGWYTENYTSLIPHALAGGAFIGSAGDGKISSATRADYAEAAVVALTGQGHASKMYELAGDQAYTLRDLAAEISRQTGKTIPYKNMREADYAAALVAAGLPEPLAKAIAGWDIGASKGALFDDSHQLSTLIGRPTTPMSSAVADALRQVS